MRLDRIGHTGITWPSTPEGVRTAITDIAAVGYHGFETFGPVIDRYPGGVPALRDDLARQGLAFAAAYCYAPLMDAASVADDIAAMVRWARMVADLGGKVIVVGAMGRAQPQYAPEDYRRLARTLGEIGRRCLEFGVTAAFHPHTGTPVETSAEIDALFSQVDPRFVFFAPDTGQIQKGGSDPVQIVRAYRELVRHVHLKDFVGGTVEFTPEGREIDRTGYLNYAPLGRGVVDLPAIVQLLDEAGFTGWWMVELDRLATSAASESPREAADISKRYLDALLAREPA
jgi:inosose dehydratase